MEAELPIRVDGVNHHFGQGALRKQILFDVTTEIRSGEIVIVTGPSGSGKTTLLTLIGGLRETQDGSLEVLGQQLRGASRGALQNVRKQIGYIFQAHNLLDALTASQNVQMALNLRSGHSRSELQRGANEMLEAVGLREYVDKYPSELSGGQRQRVAIARALVSRPRMILADEPTASLDKQSGRDVVDLMRVLAKGQGVAVLLVTHDNRILDIADRIIHLEDGRLSSFTDAVIENTRHMMTMLAESNRKGDLTHRVKDMPVEQFVQLLERVTRESQEFLTVTDLAESDAFESMLEQILQAFTFKLGRILEAERASLFLVDRARGELWLKVAQKEGQMPVELRIPMDSGIAGHVAATGEGLRIDDAYSHPRFNPAVDRQTGFRTRSILCLPIRDTSGQVFAVAQLLNREDGKPFEADDEKRFAEFLGSIGVILKSWWLMSGRSRQPS